MIAPFWQTHYLQNMMRIICLESSVPSIYIYINLNILYLCIGSDAFVTYLHVASPWRWPQTVTNMWEVYNTYNIINSHIFICCWFYSHREASVHGHEILVFKIWLSHSLLKAPETAHCTLHLSVLLLISSMCSTFCNRVSNLLGVRAKTR